MLLVSSTTHLQMRLSLCIIAIQDDAEADLPSFECVCRFSDSGGSLSAASHNPESGLSALLLQTDHAVLLQPLQAPIHFKVWRRFDDLVEYCREFHRLA